MAKPAATDIDNAVENWETTINDNFDVVLGDPLPVYEDAATSLAALTTNKPPSSYDRCMCWINEASLGWVLCACDGTTWKIIGTRATDPGALSITMPSDSPATADALRDDLVANALQDLEDGINAIRSALVAVNLM